MEEWEGFEGERFRRWVWWGNKEDGVVGWEGVGEWGIVMVLVGGGIEEGGGRGGGREFGWEGVGCGEGVVGVGVDDMVKRVEEIGWEGEEFFDIVCCIVVI